MDKKIKRVLMLLIALSVDVSAGGPVNIGVVPCMVIRTVIFVIISVGYSLVALMIIYGGVKYTFSADDPSGRKQGKNIVIFAIIGGVLLMIWTGIKDMLATSITWLDWTSCIP